jgi:hypothetical protein
MSDTRRRAFVAALVGMLGATVGVAGVGHAYLREWRRAVAWFTFILGTELVLLSVFADPAAVVAEEGSTASALATLTSTAATLPTTVTVPLLILLVLSTLDAYRVALTQPRAGGTDGPTCPYCGESVDPELDFCPWCTERFEQAPAEADGTTPHPVGHDQRSSR